MKFKQFLLVIITVTGLLLSPIVVSAQTLSAKAALDTSSITTGESVRLNITVEGSTLASEPVLKIIDGLQIDFLGRNSSVNYINGEYSAIINYSYEITGLKPGSYTLGPFDMKVKNDKLTANSVTLQVSGAVNQKKSVSTIPDNSSPFGDKLFMEMELGKTKLYLGEKTPLKIRVYFSEITINDWSYPVIEQPDFVLDPMNKPSQRRVTINSRSYQVVEFSTNLTSVKSGKFSLGPARLNFAVLIKQQTSDPFFSSFKKYPIELKSNRLNINVLPLPTGKPANFSGGIGRFQIQVTGQPTEVLQGEPVTLKLTVTGNGNLQTVDPPFIINNQGLKVYDPQKKNNNNGETGQIHFEQVVIPIDPNVKQIGPFNLSYFDPYQGKYVKATAPAFAVKVKPNPNFKAVLFSDTTETDSDSYGKDLVFIKEQLGSIKRRHEQLVYQSWFWWLQLLPILGLIVALGYRKYQKILLSDSPMARSIRAGSRAAKGLARVKTELIKKPENTLEELHQLVKEYLGEKYQLTIAGMTGNDVEQIAAYGVESDTLRKIKDFFDQYDYYRFTGSKISPTEAEQLWEQVDLIIKTLDQVGNYNQEAGKAPERRGQNGKT